MPKQIPASKFLEKLSKLNKEELLQVDGIGEILADNILNFAKSKRFETLSKDLKKLEGDDRGILLSTKDDQELEGKLTKEIICITGKFDKSRLEIKEILEKEGAKVVSAITSKTTILLAGKEAGSKLTKAEKLEIKIINDYKNLL